MISLCLLAYVIRVWLDEAIRDIVYGELDVAQIPEALLNKPLVDANAHPKWRLYSGLFILFKQKLCLPSQQVEVVAQIAANAFAILIFGNVRTFV